MKDDNDKIAKRAYELYIERGGSNGNDQEDWFKAEKELSSKSSGKSKASVSVKTVKKVVKKQ